MLLSLVDSCILMLTRTSLARAINVDRSESDTDESLFSNGMSGLLCVESSSMNCFSIGLFFLAARDEAIKPLGSFMVVFLYVVYVVVAVARFP